MMSYSLLVIYYFSSSHFENSLFFIKNMVLVMKNSLILLENIDFLKKNPIFIRIIINILQQSQSSICLIEDFIENTQTKTILSSILSSLIVDENSFEHKNVVFFIEISYFFSVIIEKSNVFNTFFKEFFMEKDYLLNFFILLEILILSENDISKYSLILYSIFHSNKEIFLYSVSNLDKLIENYMVMLDDYDFSSETLEKSENIVNFVIFLYENSFLNKTFSEERNDFLVIVKENMGFSLNRVNQIFDCFLSRIDGDDDYKWRGICERIHFLRGDAGLL